MGYTVAVPSGGDPSAEHNELRAGLLKIEAQGLFGGFSGWGLPGNIWVDGGNEGNGGVGGCDNGSGVFFGNLAYIPGDSVLTGLRTNIATAAASGATMRMGAYRIDAGALSLVVDSGTVAIDTTGHKVVTGLTVPLTQGYYLIGGACTVGAVNVYTHKMRPLYVPSYDINPSMRPKRAWYISGVGTGALPSNPTGLAGCMDWDSTFCAVIMGW